MTARLLTGWLLVAFVSPGTAPARAQEEAASEERIVRTLQVSEGDVLELHNLSGDVTLTGTSGNELRIEALKHAPWVDVHIAQRGARVEVMTRTRGRGRRGGEVDYSLRVPAGMVLDVQSVSGNVTATNVGGRARLRAVAGDITASGLERLDAAETLSGDVRISSSAGQGDATVKTTSGDIRLDDVALESLTMTTVSGDVRLSNLSATWLEITSVSGDIEFAGPLSPTGRYTLATHSGDVRFRPEATSGFALTAGSFSGSVHSDFPITTRSVSGQQGRRSLQGTVGDGGASVELTTFSGDITLLQ